MSCSATQNTFRKCTHEDFTNLPEMSVDFRPEHWCIVTHRSQRIFPEYVRSRQDHERKIQAQSQSCKFITAHSVKVEVRAGKNISTFAYFTLNHFVFACLNESFQNFFYRSGITFTDHLLICPKSPNFLFTKLFRETLRHRINSSARSNGWG